jgi:hypothetical protein
MDDLASRLGELLGNPESLERIKALAGMLGGGEAALPPVQEAPAQNAPKPAEPSFGPESMEKLRALAGMLGGAAQGAPSFAQGSPEPDADIMRTVMKLAPMLSRARQEDDSTRLLRALRPFLGEARRKKLDEAIKLMQLVRVVPFLRGGGLF